MNIEVSEIKDDDLEALADLYQQLVPNQSSIEKMREVLLSNRDNPNHVVLVAKQDGRVIGSLFASCCEMLFGECKSFMVIEDVVVDENHRRKRIGQELMYVIEDYALRNNCSYIMLITDTDRKGSQYFYSSLGYKTDEYCAFKKQL